MAARPASGIDVGTLKGIVAAAPLSSVGQQGLSYLQDWLQKMYGVSLSLKEGSDAGHQSENVILLGRDAALASGLVRQDELDAVSPGGHVIKCGNGRIVIAGPDDWATVYGVVAFLERLGVRFYLGYPFDGRNPVPKPGSRIIESFTVADRPVFPFRSAYELTFRETFKQVADPHKGATPEIFTSEAGSDLWYDHTSGYLVPKRLYYDEHPEYYPMLKNGKRIAKEAFSDARTALCLSNPDVAAISAERLLAWIEKEQERSKRYFFVTYGDTTRYCQCPACLKLDEGVEPVRSRYGFSHYALRHLHWVNPVARAVAKKFPDKILFTFAYAGSSAPPKKAHVEKNIWIIASTGLGGVRFWDHGMGHADAQRKYCAKIDGWLKIVPDGLLVCEYHSQMYKPAMLDTMAGRLRAYAKRGLRGVTFTYGAPLNFQPLWKYVFARMKWNPHQDPHALAREFIEFYYGPGARHIVRVFELAHERYVRMLEDGVRIKVPWHHWPPYYEPAFVEKTLACFAAAAGAPGTDAKTRAAIHEEEGLFLSDVLRNLPSYELSDEVKQQFRSYLSRRRDLAKAAGKERDFVSATRHLALSLEKKHKGYHQLIEGWLKEWFWWLNPPEPGKGPGEGEEGEELEDDLLDE